MTDNAASNDGQEASLSDEALAVFAFAAYHQLESGDKVSRVVVKDGAGHQADGKAIEELTEGGFGNVEAERFVFTQAGEAVLGRVINALREAVR